MANPEIFLARHGETEWSLNGRHTGTTDIPLTDNGRRHAEALGARLRGREFAAVFTSPLARAADTCKLAGLGGAAEVRHELMEWNYGEYEGRTTADIRETVPGWTVWSHGSPGGESAAEVGARCDALIEELVEIEGNVACFAHGHILRVLGARWMGIAPEKGANLALSTGTLSVLGWERVNRTLALWNDGSHIT
ncbi:MAG: histidine phosphatase family protein [Thermoleophilaceae bacterium]|nr:histidine phosphatase family protein [Thermoleophilaceae bacterium]